jgi:hypothetical protein
MRNRSRLITASLLAAGLACGGESTSAPTLAPSETALSAKAPSAPTATFYLSNDPMYLLRGDGANVEGVSSPFAGTSRYKDGECGISAVIRSLPGGSGDATMGTSVGGKCVRRLRLAYAAINDDGTTTDQGSLSVQGFMNVRKLHVGASGSSAAVYIPIGNDSLRTFAFDDDGARCGTAGTGAIAFVPVLTDGTVTGADRVRVRRDSANTWTVSTDPDEVTAAGDTIHHDKAYCKGNGVLYHVPLRFTIKSSTALTP